MGIWENTPQFFGICWSSLGWGDVAGPSSYNGYSWFEVWQHTSKWCKFLMLQTYLCVMISIHLVMFFNIPVPRARRLQENTILQRFYTLRILTAVFCSCCTLNKSIYLESSPKDLFIELLCSWKLAITVFYLCMFTAIK